MLRKVKASVHVLAFLRLRESRAQSATEAVRHACLIWERPALVCLRWRNSRPSPGIIGLNKKSETWYRNGYCTIYWQFNYNYYSLPCRYLHVMTRLENDPNKTQLMLFWVYKVSSSNTKNCKSSCSILQYRPCSRRNGPWIDVLDVSIMKLTIKILSCNE